MTSQSSQIRGKIYCNLNIFVDWKRTIRNRFGRDPASIPCKILKKCLKQTDYPLEIMCSEEGMKLWSYLHTTGIPVVILISDQFRLWNQEAKMNWCHSHLGATVNMQFVSTKDGYSIILTANDESVVIDRIESKKFAFSDRVITHLSCSHETFARIQAHFKKCTRIYACTKDLNQALGSHSNVLPTITAHISSAELVDETDSKYFNCCKFIEGENVADEVAHTVNIENANPTSNVGIINCCSSNNLCFILSSESKSIYCRAGRDLKFEEYISVINGLQLLITTCCSFHSLEGVNYCNPNNVSELVLSKVPESLLASNGTSLVRLIKPSLIKPDRVLYIAAMYATEELEFGENLFVRLCKENDNLAKQPILSALERNIITNAVVSYTVGLQPINACWFREDVVKSSLYKFGMTPKITPAVATANEIYYIPCVFQSEKHLKCYVNAVRWLSEVREKITELHRKPDDNFVHRISSLFFILTKVVTSPGLLIRGSKIKDIGNVQSHLFNHMVYSNMALAWSDNDEKMCSQDFRNAALHHLYPIWPIAKGLCAITAAIGREARDCRNVDPGASYEGYKICVSISRLLLWERFDFTEKYNLIAITRSERYIGKNDSSEPLAYLGNNRITHASEVLHSIRGRAWERLLTHLKCVGEDLKTVEREYDKALEDPYVTADVRVSLRERRIDNRNNGKRKSQNNNAGSEKTPVKKLRSGAVIGIATGCTINCSCCVKYNSVGRYHHLNQLSDTKPAINIFKEISGYKIKYQDENITDEARRKFQRCRYLVPQLECSNVLFDWKGPSICFNQIWDNEASCRKSDRSFLLRLLLSEQKNRLVPSSLISSSQVMSEATSSSSLALNVAANGKLASILQPPLLCEYLGNTNFESDPVDRPDYMLVEQLAAYYYLSRIAGLTGAVSMKLRGANKMSLADNPVTALSLLYQLTTKVFAEEMTTPPTVDSEAQQRFSSGEFERDSKDPVELADPDDVLEGKDSEKGDKLDDINSSNGRSIGIALRPRSNIKILSDINKDVKISCATTDEQIGSNAEVDGYLCAWSESNLWLNLLFLLMWDEIFDTTVPYGMVRPFQLKPLDLIPEGYGNAYPAHNKFFFKRRKSGENGISKRLEYIKNCTAKQLRYEVLSKYYHHFNKPCFAMRWDKINVLEVASLAQSVGGARLQEVLMTMLELPTLYFRGAPDLMIWKIVVDDGEDFILDCKDRDPKHATDNTSAERSINACGGRTDLRPNNDDVLAVEVKSENDRLSRWQILWIELLVRANIPVEVLKVHSI